MQRRNKPVPRSIIAGLPYDPLFPEKRNFNVETCLLHDQGATPSSEEPAQIGQTPSAGDRSYRPDAAFPLSGTGVGEAQLHEQRRS